MAKQYNARTRGRNIPAGSHIVPDSPKAPDCPELLELLLIHYGDKSRYKVSSKYENWRWCVYVDVTAGMPYARAIRDTSPAVVRFFVREGKLWCVPMTGIIGGNAYVVGVPEDPDLLSRADGYISSYLQGAEHVRSWVKGSFR